MRKIVQAVSGLNALFQGVVGLLSVVSPATAAAVFGVDPGGPGTLALVRMLGGLLAASGIVSGWVARDPDRDAGLLGIFAVGLLVNVAADAVVIGCGEMRFDQLAVGMLLELGLAILLLAYRLRSTRAGRDGGEVTNAA